MPGNEVGGRVHNFFDQGSLSQDQRHTQFVAANWPGYNTNVWNASERQIDKPVSAGSEHYNSQQLDIERGQGNHFAFGPNGLNLARSNLRPEFVKSPSQFPQFHLNGFLHTSQIGHTRQNEANFLGVDTEPDQCNVTSRNSILESPQRSGSVLADSASFGGSESPMNFNFFGGQHQMNGQQAGMMQPLPQQQPGNNDSQMQQQFILKQMELQRQHQLQQFEAIKRNAGGQISHFPNETAGQHLPQINGNQLRDTSNCLWPSQVHTASNTNWQQRGLSSSVPGYANGFMISPEQGQSMHFMGLNPQQTTQSLYGVPVSSSHRSNAFSHGNIDKSGTLQVPGPTSSFSGNQYGTLEGQSAVKEGNMVSRYGSEGKSSFQRASSQRLGNMVNLGGFTQAQQRKLPISEGSGQGFATGIELAAEKPVTQASSQGTVGLDPTEEKILFGSDDNIWEAFGGASLTGSGDATDHLNSLSSMQSGTWSALMQSAVAETSSTDGGVHVGSQNSRVQSGSQHHLVFNSKEKSQDNMVDSFQRASLGSQRSGNDLNIYNANANSNVNYVNSLGQQHQFANQGRDYLRTESDTTQVGRRLLDYQQQKPHVEEKRVVENSNSSRDFSSTDSGFWGHQPRTLLSNNNSYQSGQPSPSNYIGSAPANGSIDSSNQHNLFGKDREVQVGMDTSRSAVMRLEPVPNSNIKMGKDNAGAPSLSNVKIDHKSIRNLPDNHQLDLLMSVNSSGKSGSEGVGSDHYNLNKGPPMSGSLNNSPDDGAAEIHETENIDRRENSIGIPGNNFCRNASVGNFREDFQSLPGGKEKSSSQAGKRGQITQNFQYHPMGDVDVNLDFSHGAKQILDSQSMSQNLLVGVQGQEANPSFLGPSSTNITDKEGKLFDYHVPINVSGGVSPNQHMSPSQNMLELLHKVDQSKEQNAASHIRSSEYNMLSNTSGGGVAGPSQSHLSTSHAFSLQLAPPSQGIGRPKTPNLGDSVQRSSRSVSSPGTDYVASEIGDKTHSWLASSVSSAQCLPSSHKPTQMDSGIEPGRLGNMDVNLKDNSSVSGISTPQSEQSTAPGGKIIGDQASVAFDRQGYQDQQLNDSQSQVTSHLVTNSHGNLVAERDMNHPGVQALVHKMPAPFYPVMAGMSRKDNLSHLGNL